MANVNRRALLGCLAAGLAVEADAARAQPVAAAVEGDDIGRARPLTALFFDVFGTLVDLRASLAKQAKALLAPRGYAIDWADFADAWIDEYQPGLQQVRSGRRPFVKLDVLLSEGLERVVPRFKLDGLDAEARRLLGLAWNRLDAWPDVPAGMKRLYAKFRLAPCANGTIVMMVDVARRNGFSWDTVLGAEIARDYKPNPRTYLASAEAFGLDPGACMMVAAHSYDLDAAARLGFRTAHIARPDESGPGTGETRPGVPVDHAVRGVGELADMLGA